MEEHCEQHQPTKWNDEDSCGFGAPWGRNNSHNKGTASNPKQQTADSMNIHHEVVDLVSDSSSEDLEPPIFLADIAGPPIPQGRPRCYRKIWMNPDQKKKKAIKEELLGKRPTRGVMFPKGTAVVVELEFQLRRPNSHFVGGNRVLQQLKTWAQRLLCSPTGADIDNLAKFYLDAMNGIVCHDDRQVVELRCFKCLDSGDGKTHIMVCPSRHMFTNHVI